MSAFCCLKPSASTDGMDPAKPANKRGITKTGAELLAGQQNGMSGRYDEYGAFGLGMDDPYYSGEDSQVRQAIDEFMRSPKANARKNAQAAQQNLQSMGVSPRISASNRSLAAMTPQANGANPTSPMSSFRKTGVVISKKYHMLCGNCCRRFQKIMLVELTTSPIDTEMTVFDVPSLFNSSTNHEYDCPFCFSKVNIVLNESLLIGDAQQLDYNRTIDMQGSNQMKNSTFKTETSLVQTTDCGNGDLLTQQTGTEAPETTRPQLIYTKFQRLKHTTTLASVKIIDECPWQSAHNKSIYDRIVHDSDFKQGTTRMSTNDLSFDNNTNGATAASGGMNLLSTKSVPAAQKQQQPKTLAYYPEELHSVSKEECADFNSRVMKHLMKRKMGKNQTFYQSKMMGVQQQVRQPQVLNVQEAQIRNNMQRTSQNITKEVNAVVFNK